MTDLTRTPPALNLKLPRLDLIWAFIVLSPLLWWVLREAYGLEILTLGHDHSSGSHVGSGHVVSQPAFLLDSLIYIAPYFAFALLIGAYAVASDAAELVNRAFRYNQPLAIVLAALAGALSPLCSCGVIPLIAALLVARVPVAPIMAFWLASPLMAPEQFAITQAALSIPFATTKGTFALMIGLAGGYVTYALSRHIDLSADRILRPGMAPKSCCGSGNERQDKPVVWAFWTESPRRIAFVESLWTTGFFLGKWLLLAFGQPLLNFYFGQKPFKKRFEIKRMDF